MAAALVLLALRVPLLMGQQTCTVPRDVTVPDIAGVTQSEAEAAIASAGGTVGTVTEQSSEVAMRIRI